MNLRYLAPDIQEHILFLPRVRNGRARVVEKTLRSVASLSGWEAQRRALARVVGQAEPRTR